MNSVYIDSAVANSPIYIGPTNANSVIVGNTNCTTNLVGPINIGTTTPNTVNIGKEGASTNLFGITNLGIVTSGTKSSYIEVGTGGGNAVIDFHSSGLFDTDNDSRIMATGGSSTATQGKLNYYAASHVFNGNVSMNAGSNITLQPTTGYVAPSAGQLGVITGGTAFPTGTPNITSNVTLSTITIPTAGVYMLSWWCQANCNSVPTNIYIVLSWTVPISGTDYLLGNAIGFNQLQPASFTYGSNFSFPMNITGTGTITATFIFSGSTITSLKGFFNATRIG